MDELKKTITIKVKENEYEVKFPNNGQLMDIESMKQVLSKGHMDSMLISRNAQSNLVYITIDMISTFTILIPGLIKDLRVDSLLDLDPIETKELRKIYVEQYHEWFNKWMDEINSDIEVKHPDEGVYEEDDDIAITN
jgi:tRNA-dihydrouridine synthase